MERTHLGGRGPAVRTVVEGAATPVDEYWGTWTVNSKPFTDAKESLDYLEWRSSIYPLFAAYMDAYGDHAGEVVLDYGCGPGNDTVGFLVHSRAAKVIGVDVSQKALDLASGRIGLHEVDERRAELIRISDSNPRIPIEANVVDYIHCLGVIHHTSHPGSVLREFERILRPGGRGSIMVYNRESIFFHLWIAYRRQLIEGLYAGMDAESAFSRATDGEDCPIARPYRPSDFIELCLAAGLEAEFVGGYFATMELDLMKEIGGTAAADPRLGVEHRNFLKELTLDDKGSYLYRDRTAGHGGVFSIRKPA